MESDPTEAYLPQYFPYPIKVVSLDVAAGGHIERGTRLLSYSFLTKSKVPDSKPETRFGTWDSSIEGTVDTWNIKVGDVVSLSQARQRPVVVIIEPCKHGMQLGGLCVVCGKDMTNTDYTGFSDASRASIQMTHSAFGPTVSYEEAQRIERETANHLLKSRKLSLIVDLDQTIVHATVDPTVGEWISEGEAWEARQAKKDNKPPAIEGQDDSDEESDDEEEEDECNPNWEALKDVKKFTLGPESFGSLRAGGRSKGKHRMVEQEGCMYYIKPRPGWKEFLQEASKKYELHVYTMGTSAYAEEVCAAIDPDGKIFGNRLLSRDESGSLTQKSLQRLFPCDTSMVVIIDDRADVWEWSPNLIKVIPYDFFVGIGDINSTFLPKLDGASLLVATPSPKEVKPTKPPSLALNNGDEVPTPSKPDELPKDDQPSTPEAATPETPPETVVLVNKNNAALDAQLEERPLAKKEKELQEQEQAAEHTPSVSEDSSGSSSATETPSEHHHHHRKALLKNDDAELQRVGKLLNEVHDRFYTSYDTRSPANNRRKVAPGSRPYDVTRIIPRIRAETFEDCHILFSGLIPLDTRPESTEIWRSATMFGARCYTDLTNEITHVVAAKLGTVKVDMARKRGHIAIVSQTWLSDSLAQWRRMDERPYLLEEPQPVPQAGPSSSPIADTHEKPTTPTMDDEDDWDVEESYGNKEAGTLALNAIDWNDINDEVEAAMMESDDDDEDDTRSNKSGTRSGYVSEEDWGDDVSIKSASAGNTPILKRKRLRSTTPSEAGLEDLEMLRSPLAKRKRVAAERTGLSRLKEEITSVDGRSNGGTPTRNMDQAEEEEEDDEEDDEEAEPFDLDDDFLAGELEEEWS